MSTPNVDYETTWYGLQRVHPDTKTARVRRVFDSVAQHYDRMNDLMSGGLHRLWKATFVRRLNILAEQVFLDVAGGTGDIARRVKARAPEARVIVCDINPAMMAVGQTRDRPTRVPQTERAPPFASTPSSIQWLAGDAAQLPVASHSVDVVGIAFGLRNVARIDEALAEFRRVLRPGGRFLCLEFNPDVALALRPFYRLWCTNVLPRLGDLVAHDREAYTYLAESIVTFSPPPLLAQRMMTAGFVHATWQRLSGGIAVIHEAWRA